MRFSYWVFLFAGIFLYAELPDRRGARRRLVQLRAVLARSPYNPGINIDVYALGMVLLGISTTVGSINFIVTLIAHARAGHVDQPGADPGLGHADRIGRQPLRRAGGEPGVPHALDGSPASARTSSMCQRRRPAAALAAPVLDVRPSVGLRRSCCRRWASSSDGLPTFCRRPLVGYTAVALATVDDHGARLRRLGAPHVRDRPAADLAVVLQRRELRSSSSPSAVAVFAWIATIWTGRPVVHDAVPVLRRLRAPVRDRRRLGLHDRRGAARLAAHRHLLRRRAPALRADRDQRLSGASAASTTGFRSSPAG